MGDDPIREEIERECVVERDGWAGDRVARVTTRLQRDVPFDERLETLVIWVDDQTAFTAPGRTIYISRRLLERFASDDAAAFVVAHELAHHLLGHIPRPPTTLLRLPIDVAIALIRMRIATPARERDADLLAIELCLEAGYDAARCISALDHLDRIALDYGDVDGALGADPSLPGWLMRRTHPPTRERIAAVRAHADAWRRGHSLATELAARDRERRARRKRVLAAAGAAALAVGLIALRRRLPSV